MNDFLKDIQNTFMARIKNMLLLNFIIAWCVVNYKIVLKVLFEDTDINTKILYLEPSSIGIWYGIIFPLLITGIYIYIIPFLNLYVVIGYNKFVNKKIQEHKKETLKEYYIRQKEIEREKLKATTFLKETMELEQKAEKLKQEKEEISIEEQKIIILEKTNEIKKDEINSYEQEKIRLTKDIEELTTKNASLLKEYNELKKLYDERKDISIDNQIWGNAFKAKTPSTQLLGEAFKNAYNPKFNLDK